LKAFKLRRALKEDEWNYEKNGIKELQEEYIEVLEQPTPRCHII